MRAYKRVVLHRKVILNLTDGTAIEGVLWAEEGPLLVLRGATMHEAGSQVDMDGEILVHTDRVRFAQVVN